MASRKLNLDVDIDMPKIIEITSDELALIETYMRDLVAEMAMLDAINHND